MHFDWCTPMGNTSSSVAEMGVLVIDPLIRH